MAKLLAIATRKTEWEGRIYYPGEVYEGENSPGAYSGWTTHEDLPGDGADANAPFISSGRGQLSWRKTPPLLPEPDPVVVGHDVLRNEPVYDEVATKRLSNIVWEINNLGRPKRSREDEYCDHLHALIRNPIVDPEMKLYARQQLGEESPLPANPAEQEELAQPAAEPPIEAPEEPAPAADPGELEDLLEDLLDQEARAAQAGDAQALASVRGKIEIVLK